MSPLDEGFCPFCTIGEITGAKLLIDQIEPGDKFHCPVCNSVLTYTLAKNFPTDKIFLHYQGDPRDLYGKNTQTL